MPLLFNSLRRLLSNLGGHTSVIRHLLADNQEESSKKPDDSVCCFAGAMAAAILTRNVAHGPTRQLTMLRYGSWQGHVVFALETGSARWFSVCFAGHVVPDV